MTADTAVGAGAESGSVRWGDGEVRAREEWVWGEEEVAAGSEDVEWVDAHCKPSFLIGAV